jgi:hypothetical protein
MKKEKVDKKKLDLQKKKVDDFTTKMKLAEKLAGVALGTSRLNYIDPRITLAWCKEAEFDFKRLFPKTQQVCHCPLRPSTLPPSCRHYFSPARSPHGSYAPPLQAKFQWAIDEIINSDSKAKFEW